MGKQNCATSSNLIPLVHELVMEMLEPQCMRWFHLHKHWQSQEGKDSQGGQAFFFFSQEVIIFFLSIPLDSRERGVGRGFFLGLEEWILMERFISFFQGSLLILKCSNSAVILCGEAGVEMWLRYSVLSFKSEISYIRWKLIPTSMYGSFINIWNFLILKFKAKLMKFWVVKC